MVLTDLPSLFQLYSQEIRPREINYELYAPMFAWLPWISSNIHLKTHCSTTGLPWERISRNGTNCHSLHVMCIDKMNQWQQIPSTQIHLPLQVEQQLHS